MFKKKIYGQSRIDNCPFCGKRATVKNSQDVPVCHEHKKSDMPDLKCACGEWLDIRAGKWGPYFNCMKCGNVSWWKGLEMNPGLKPVEKKKVKEKNYSGSKYNKRKSGFPKPNENGETVITSEECDIYFS